MKRKIILHGYLRRRFGRSFDLNVSTPAEAVHALSVQLKGFPAALRRGEFRVIRGRLALAEGQMFDPFGLDTELNIVPVACGCSGKGVGKIILGVALLGIGWAVAGMSGAALFGVKSATFTAMGIGSVLCGLGQMLSPTPTIESNEGAATKQSYLFSGVTNVTEEGNIIPVAYGTVWCGSLVLSAGLDVLQVGDNG